MAQFRKDTYRYLPQETTLFETVMIADKFGNVTGANPSGMAVDAFGRMRVSQPLTLFDSFHRYQDNERINTANTANTTVVHDANSSSIICSVSTANNDYVYRESSRVFSYQPGKALQILQTYVLAPLQTNLRQRIGYFGKENGIFLEAVDNQLSFVIRNNSGGLMEEEKVLQENWNIDSLDGSGPSAYTLDISKAQIMFIDIEWLGLGTVRCGFVIDGQLIHCHSFHHSNIISQPYMGTACLPVRAEIENIGPTTNTSNLRLVCSTVISEGGYEPRGRQRTVGQLPNVSYTLSTAGVFYPVVALRLKSNREDGIVLPRNIHLLGKGGNGSTLQFKIVSGANVSGGTWVNAGDDSSVQYNMTSNTMIGGDSLKSGYIYVAQQGQSPITLDGDVFRYQLERNSFAGTNTTFVLAVAGSSNGDTCVGSIDWEEST